MDKKEFLKQFKSMVKGEGGNLPTEYIVERIKMGDISEGDMASFTRYIPFQLGFTIDAIMGRRKLLGILKSLKEIADDKSKLQVNTPVETATKMIRDMKITYEDILKIGYDINKDISKAITSQIDKFLKMVIGYKSLPEDQKNKEKFKIEKLLRMKVITEEYLEKKKVLKEEIEKIIGSEYKRYLQEEPYDTEIKDLIERYAIDESISKYLPEKYLQYYLKKYPESSKNNSVYKKRRKTSSVMTGSVLSKQDVSELQKILLKEASKKPIQQPAKSTSRADAFSEERLLNFIADLEQKENKKEASKLVKKLKDLGFETKTSRKINPYTEFSKIKKQYVSAQKRKQKIEDALNNEQPTPVASKSRGVVTNLYSIERKLEDLKRGKTPRYLSRLEKNKLESQLVDIMKKEKTVTKRKSSMDIDRQPGSPVGSTTSSSSLSSQSSSSRRGSRASSVSSRRSSRSSVTSNGSVGKFVKEKEEPMRMLPTNFIQLGKTSSGDLDIDTLKVMTSFVRGSVPFVGSKRKSKDMKKLNVDIEKLKKYAEEEREAEKKSSLKRRRSSGSAKLSPYDMKRIN